MLGLPEIDKSHRTELLMRLGRALQKQEVSATFWACLQVGDLSALERFVREVEASPRLCKVLSHSFDALPRLWRQKALGEGFSDIDTELSSNHSSGSQASDKLWTATMSPSAADIARSRDGKKCVITGTTCLNPSQIFPLSLLKPKATTDINGSLPNIWEILNLLFDYEHVLQWKSAILQSPDGMDTVPENLICLCPMIHIDWVDAYCAFKPLYLSPDRRELTLEFHWLPTETHSPRDHVSLFKSPSSSKNLQGTGNRYAITADLKLVKSGHVFVLKTHNPVTHPLPSIALLDMAWKLSQIVRLSGARDEDLGGLQKDYNTPHLYNLQAIREWAAESSSYAHKV
ncbi:hypothetical protein BDV25DRAFT_150151 [Aspergillus avenaceus]|uniref:Uncharacterized protein n=1 Tax=Aspergillus avenaceus TaxID=36643 RepID=A0A5N6U355_ASPAV|nr:hypothetical protein BDV25DRAFT_150151 [Aspergillus avenaceus]